MRRILQALFVLALLPGLVSTAAAPAPRLQDCHYSAIVLGDITTRSGYVLRDVPIGRIEVTDCASPADLANRVETLTNQVRAQATAQATR